MRFAWITDPHLSRVPLSLRERWLSVVAAQKCDAVILSGDIAESLDVVQQLRDIWKSLELPIYFVLGNHDFYGATIGATCGKVIRCCRESDPIHYLTDLSPISVGEHGETESAGSAMLVGEDGWGDATVGDYENSYVRLNDFLQIADFSETDKKNWKPMLQQLGAAAAERLAAKLKTIPSDTKNVLIVTHVPPFREACWYEGRTTDDDWAPFFVCGQVGAAIRHAAQARPDCQFTVLCGHTHHSGSATVEPNVIVHTGAARYGEPGVAAVIEVSGDSVGMQPPVDPHS